ncbi:hypothetical protein B0I37DRAFT_419687 [Chaetomium sp. MPI-CAGE-AT-0009]|nr:hypothetical protein B0I37DRAFT_419687 [Chaetomium sp. MPI-CAGE-AT-0009]
MGASSKVLSVILRLGELSSSVIVLGLVGRVLWHVGQANTYSDARLVFVTVVACISTVASLLLMAPFTFTFFACPFDLVLFVLWLVAFIFLELLTGINTCNAVWYYSYWGYYWAGFWRTPFIVTGPWDIGWSGCSSLRAVLAFSFIAAMGYLCSCFLGAYVVMKYKEEKKKRIVRGDYHGRKTERGVLQEANTNSTTPA